MTLRSMFVIWLVVWGSPGCSLLFSYSGVELGDPDAGSSRDGAPPLSSGEVWEGTGALVPGEANPGSRPHVLVVRGAFAQDSILTLESPGGLEIGPTTVSTNGTLAAMTVRVPIMLDLGQDDAPLAFNILATSGEVTAPRQLLVRGLDELTSGEPLVSDELYERYSMIELDQVRITGVTPARLHAISHLDLGGVLSVAAENSTPGPGGCAGGAAGASADCGEGGGKRGGLTNGGGGGGGHQEMGTAGLKAGVDDQTTGRPGVATGNPMLVPLKREGGNGGGGGGGTAGAAGGGGGGVIELRAHGPIRFLDTAALRAEGGDGGAAGCASNEGGGGGGAGGAILMRATGGFVFGEALDFNSISVAGGAGRGEALCVGGNGSAGRIRMDTPAAAVLGAGTQYGPMWSREAPSIVTSPVIDVELWGGTGRSYGVSVNRGAIKMVSISSGIVINSTTVSLTLAAGANEVCVSADLSADFTQDEAWNCIDIAYVPR